MKRPRSPTVINCFVSTRSCVVSCTVRSVCCALVVTSCAALVAGSPRGWPRHQRKPSLRIFDGSEDRGTDLSFVVGLLRKTNIRICTGSLIAPTWVLATADCDKVTHVQYGDMTIPRGNITSLSVILKFIKHPSYVFYKYLPTEQMYYNDIAIALVERIPGEPGKLSGLDYQSLTGTKVKYVGLGITNMSMKNTFDNTAPRQVANGIVASCRDVARELFFFPKICVASQCSQPQSGLPGDSGGPLLLDNKIIGITVAILYEPRITIFTPVSPYLSWIRKIMDQNLAPQF